MDSNFMMNQMTNPMDYADRIEKMYPDVYRKMMPYIDDAVMDLTPDMQFSEDELNKMAYQIVRNSNIMSEPPHGHNESTINDIVRILLLVRLFRGFSGDQAIPAFFPFFPFSPLFFPFWWGRDGRRPHDGRGHRRW